MPNAASILSIATGYYKSGRSIPANACLSVVADILGGGPGVRKYHKYNSATDAYQAAAGAGRVHSGTDAPAGAVYYWDGGSHGYGHIAISAGNGYIFTTDYPTKGKVGYVKLSQLNRAWGATGAPGRLRFRGWSDAVNGARINGLGSVAPARLPSPPAGKKKTSAPTNTKDQVISKSDLAAGLASRGYSTALLSAVPELKSIYEAYIKRGDNGDTAINRFIGDIKNSKWYRNHTESQREYDALQKTEPKTWAHNLSEAESALRTKAATMGVKIPEDRLSELAKNVYRNGLLNGANADPGVIQRLLANEFQFQPTTTKDVITPGTTTTTSGVSEFEKLRQAVVGQESGGSYSQIGTRTAKGNYAYGKYQIMDFNIPSWTKKFLGKSMTPQEFLKDHAAQDEVASGMLKEYYDKYGAAGAAAAWYSGENGAKAYLRGGGINPTGGTVGPKTRDYVDQVLARMKKIKGESSSTSATKTTVTTTGPAAAYLPGDAGEAMDQIRDLARAYGVSVTDKTLGKQIQDFLAGRNDIEGLTSYYRAMAVSKYPQFAEQLKGGTTLAEIADPYVTEMAKTLELDPEALDWSDPTVQRGLSQKDAKTGAPTSMTLWQFQDSLKKDQRWKKTDNARDSLLTSGRQVLQDMGLVN